MVNEPVDGCHGHDLVSEDGRPVSKGAVAGADQAAVLVTFRDQFEEDAGLGLVFTHLAKIVEDQAIDAIKFGQQGRQGEVASCRLQALDQIVGADEQGCVASFDEAMGEGGGQVALAGAAAAKQQAIAVGLHPVTGAQRLDPLSREAGNQAELEAVQAFARRQLRGLEGSCEAAIAAFVEFQTAENPEEAFVRPRVLRGLRGDFLPSARHGG